MWYEICVTYEGIHFFSTDKGSCRTESDLERVYGEINKRFCGDPWEVRIYRGSEVSTEVFLENRRK